MEPDPADVERVRRALGATPVAWRTASGHGAPSHRRFVVDLDRRRSAFVKIAALDYTSDWLREEHRLYWALDGHPFLPRLLGWDDDGIAPRSPSRTYPARRGRRRGTSVGSMPFLDTLDAVHATVPPDGVPPAVQSQFGPDGWPDVVADPQPFLSLGLCSPGWLDEDLVVLAEASANAEIGGTSLLHFDVRSDNLCLREGRAVLVDWNNACVGNAMLDTAAWLPSLASEGGPPPHAILPDDVPGLPEIASLLAGYFCARAGLPHIPQAPHARPLQLRRSRTSLPWAARLLGLPARLAAPLLAPATHCYDALRGSLVRRLAG